MRTNIIIILVLLSIIAMAWGSNYAIDSYCDTMLKATEAARTHITDADWPNARLQSDILLQSLIASRSWITILVNQRMLNDIEIVAERLCVSVELEDQISSLTELVSLKSYLEELRNDTFITITNLL